MRHVIGALLRVRGAVLALVLAQLACAAGAPGELSGRWRSVETSKGGVGATIVFHPGGRVDFSPAAVVDSTYRIEGRELILPPATINGPEVRQPIEFIGQNELRLAETVLTRRSTGQDSQDPIVGEWVGRREMNGRQMEAHYIFYPAAKLLFVLPFQSAPGRYVISGSVMRLELPGRRVAEGQFKIEGDTLTLPSPTGSGWRFRRY